MKNHVYMVNFRRVCGEQLIIPSGCVMTDALTPTFSAEWDGLSVMAVFCRGGAAYQVTETADGFVVPAEIAHNPGAFAWGFVGYIIEDEEVKVRISTEQTRGMIVDGAYSDTSTIPEPIEPSVWEQLVAHLGDYSNPHRVTAEQIGAADAATVDRIEQTVSDQGMAINGLNGEIRRVDGVATGAAATASAAADSVIRLSGVVAMVEQTAAGAEQTAQGAAAAIAAHEADTANPHGVTAAQVGALPITGGSLQGNLHVAGKISADNGFETIGEIEMNDHAIKGVATPVNPADAANKTYVDTGLSSKQNTLTFDNEPTADSSNPVTSDGVKSYVDAVEFNLLTDIGNKQDALTFDNVPTVNSDNPVKSGGVYAELMGKQDNLTFDTTPTASSTNPVTSGGVKAYVDGQIGDIETATQAIIALQQSYIGNGGGN